MNHYLFLIGRATHNYLATKPEFGGGCQEERPDIVLLKPSGQKIVQENLRIMLAAWSPAWESGQQLPPQ